MKEHKKMEMELYIYESHHVCKIEFINDLPYRVIEHHNEIDHDGNSLPYGALVRTGTTPAGKFQTVIVRSKK
tara:strand:+ start:201 stop:416 length:216 start_codon:yes stop_codon:yes gene_type:complete